MRSSFLPLGAFALALAAGGDLSCTSPSGHGNGTGAGAPGGSQVSAVSCPGIVAIGAPRCGAVPPSGRQLVAGRMLAVNGVTSDGFVIYTEAAPGPPYHLVVNAVPLAGGPSQTLGTIDGPAQPVLWDIDIPVQVSGTVVAINGGEGGIGPLSAWTSAYGTVALSATISAVRDVSDDGSRILYLDSSGAPPEPSAAWWGTWTVATVDGRTKTPLMTLGPMHCGLVDAKFAGADIVVSHCLPTDGSVGAVTSFTGPAFEPHTLATGLSDSGTWTTKSNHAGEGFVIDPTASNVAVWSLASGLVVYPIGGGAGTVIDPAGRLPAAFTRDAASVLYITSDGVKRSPTSSPAPVVVAAGNDLPYGSFLSPDENWIYAYSQSGLTPRLLLESASGSRAAQDLGASGGMPQGGGIASLDIGVGYGDAFTADSRFAIFSDPNAGPNDVYVAPTAGGPPTKVTTQSSFWLAGEYAPSGSKVLVADHVQVDSVRATADIEALDAEDPCAIRTVVTGARLEFYLSPDSAQIVYAWDCADGAQAGIWVTPNP
jgi:hypothetical protein